MKTLISILTIASALFFGVTNATEVKTLGQAVTACETHAKAEHQDYLRLKSYNLKQGRAGFKVNLKVSLPNSSLKSVCKIDREGNLSYAIN